MGVELIVYIKESTLCWFLTDIYASYCRLCQTHVKYCMLYNVNNFDVIASSMTNHTLL